MKGHVCLDCHAVHPAPLAAGVLCGCAHDPPLILARPDKSPDTYVCTACAAVHEVLRALCGCGRSVVALADVKDPDKETTLPLRVPVKPEDDGKPQDEPGPIPA